MSQTFFATELEGVATFWRIYRVDGLALGFTSHDRDLWFDSMMHCAAPGMLPSSIRLSSDLSPDSAEVNGALTHASISASDLALGKFDGARVEVGAVNWETLATSVVYSGTLGEVSQDDNSFTAALNSSKTALSADPLPRTSPACRAEFCGPGCTLSAARFTIESTLLAFDPINSRLTFDIADHSVFAHGFLRWVEGPPTGIRSEIRFADQAGVTIETDSSSAIAPGARAILREGCDHTLATCTGRFLNAINFQAEPFLPGNDLLSQYAGP